MATDPLSEPAGADLPEATGPDLVALRAERDAFQVRAEEAEGIAERLADELGAARAQLADRPNADHLSFFDDPGSDLSPARAADGSEPGIVPIALAGTGAFTLLVGLLSWSNYGLVAPVTLIMLAASVALGRAAWATRVVRVEVRVDDDIVCITDRDATHRFDLRSPTTRIEVLGRPGDPGWCVRFHRRALDPCDVDATMVDPDAFLARLREHRPDL